MNKIFNTTLCVVSIFIVGAATSTPGLAQQSAETRSAVVQYQIDRLVTNEIERRYGSELAQMRARLAVSAREAAHSKAELLKARQQTSEDSARIHEIEARLNAANEATALTGQQLLNLLAEQDPKLAALIETLRQSALDLLATPEGLQIIELLNENRVDEARVVMKATMSARKVADETTYALRRYKDKRANAYSFLNKTSKTYGINANIEDFEELTSDPMATALDFENLVNLYFLRGAKGDTEREIDAAKKAFQLASAPYEQVYYAELEARALSDAHRYPEAITLFNTAERLADGLSAAERRTALALVRFERAGALAAVSRRPEAELDYKSALNYAREMVAELHSEASEYWLMSILIKYGEFFFYEPERTGDARKYIEEAKTIAERLGQSNESDFAQQSIAYSYTDMARVEANSRNSGLALQYADKSLEIFTNLSNRDGEVGNWSLNIQYLNRIKASIYKDEGDYDSAVEYCDVAISISVAISDKAPDNPSYASQAIANYAYAAKVSWGGAWDEDLPITRRKKYLTLATGYSKRAEGRAVAYITKEGHSSDVDHSLAEVLWYLADNRVRGYNWDMVVRQYEALERLNYMNAADRSVLQKARGRARE